MQAVMAMLPISKHYGAAEGRRRFSSPPYAKEKEGEIGTI